MKKSITALGGHYTPAASLAALGVKLQQISFFDPIERLVRIAQKTVKYSPLDKLYDSFITILAGAHGMVEINTRLRSDPALQMAFRRKGCAEQSVVQQTLDACTDENVIQMQQALNQIFREHSRAYGHDYRGTYQLLDVDMSGMPCGPKAALARHRAILPSSAIGEADNWGGCWPHTMGRWSAIDSSTARPN